MDTVTSADGTPIAFDRFGQGPHVILVGGAFQHRAFDPSIARLASILAERFTVLNYDRRGRGDSGDTAPYAVERELEDLAALIGEATGSAFLYGSSSGGNLALAAALRGLPVTKLALWEPDILVDDSRPPLPRDYVKQLQDRAAADRGDAVQYFLTTGVALPADIVERIRETPMWAGMEQVAHTLSYDGRLVDGFRLPNGLATLSIPALIIAGGKTPWMTSGAQAVATALPNATFQLLDGQGHGVDPDVIGPVLTEFFES
jgi:pimeloyl-ACP methyl ester carboxylesterase